jgi:SNF2 family DNA or RNA helicase
MKSQPTFNFKSQPFEHQVVEGNKQIAWLKQGNNFGALFMEMGCLSGKHTKLEITAKSGLIGWFKSEPVEIPLDEFYKLFNSEIYKSRKDISFTVKSFDGKRLIDNKVVNVLDKGVKKCIRIKSGDLELTLTPDHEVQIHGVGMVRADKVSVGDLLVVQALSSEGLVIHPPVTSISDWEEEHVYDLVMTDPHRNFVANGIVVKNCGKTKSMIDIANYLFENGKINAVLLIAPMGIQSQWLESQVPVHSHVDTVDCLWQNSTSKKYKEALNNFIFGDANGKLKWFYVNVDRFSAAGNKEALSYFVNYMMEHKVLIIVDESTIIKNGSANRTKVISALGKRAKYRYILTGSPVTQSPYDLYSMCEFLRPGLFGCSLFVFQHRYGLMVQDRNPATGGKFNRLMNEKDFAIAKALLRKGMSIEEVALKIGASESVVRYLDENIGAKSPYRNLDKLKEIIMPFSSIVRKADCLDLPEKVYTQHVVEMSPEQKKIYSDLKTKMLAECDGQELRVTHKLTLLLRLQQVSGGFFPVNDPEEAPRAELIGKSNVKIEFIKHDLEEAGDLKCIIWSRFRAEIAMLESELRKEFPGKRVERYDGSKTSDEKDEIRIAAQAGEVDILIMNQQSGSRGLNLQDHFHLHYYFSNHPSLEYREQGEDRSHRMGLKCSVQYKDIICKDTVDAKIFDTLHNHKDLSEYFKTADLREFL